MRLLLLPRGSVVERWRELVAAPISVGLAVLTSAIWLAATVFDGRQLGPATAWAWRPGAAVWDGDYLVLLTSALVHFDLLHLSFNLYWLLRLGVALEAALGRWRFLGLSMLAAVVASATQLAASDSTGVGLSGVSYAWAGFAWVVRDRFPALRELLGWRAALVLSVWFGFGLAMTRFGMLELGDAAHVGGLAVGIALGAASAVGVRRVVGSVAALALFGLTGVSLRVAPWNAGWLVHQAERALEAGDSEQAESFAEQAVALSQQEPRARWILGRAALARSDWKLAIQQFEQVTADNPSFVDAHVRLGRARYSDGDYTRAIDALSRAIELAPGHGEALYFRGECRARLGEFAAAVDDFTRALALTPDVAFVPASLGWAQINLDHDPCAALAHFDRAIELGLDDSYVHSGRANANISCGRLRDALVDFEKLLAAPNPEPQSFAARCLLHWQLGDAQRATPDCLQALAARPNAFHRLLLALVTIASGDQAAGFTLLRQAIEAEPTQLAPRLWLYWLAANESALAGVNAEGFEAALLAFARQAIEAAELLRQSSEASTPRLAAAQACQAHTFLGLWHEHERDPEAAVASYRAAVAQKMPRLIEDAFARSRLRAFGVNDEP